MNKIKMDSIQELPYAVEESVKGKIKSKKQKNFWLSLKNQIFSERYK